MVFEVVCKIEGEYLASEIESVPHMVHRLQSQLSAEMNEADRYDPDPSVKIFRTVIPQKFTAFAATATIPLRIEFFQVVGLDLTDLAIQLIELVLIQRFRRVAVVAMNRSLASSNSFSCHRK